MNAYIEIIVLLHLGFSGVFYFLFRQQANRFARWLAASWGLEGWRAAVHLPWVRGLGGSPDSWYAAADVACFFANWWLLYGCAALAEVKLPRWLAPAYFWSGIPVVLFNRFWLGGIAEAVLGWPAEKVTAAAIVVNMVIIFVPVAATRTAIMLWLWRLWRRARLPGALVASLFCVPYAVVALAVPFQVHYNWSPDWVMLLWCGRVLGFSIGMVVLMFNVQQLAVVKSEARLAAAQALAKFGSWEQDMVTRVATWSAELYEIFGRERARGPMSEAEFMAAIHPRDLEKFRRARDEAVRERRTAEHEFRIVRPDGTTRWLNGRAMLEFDPEGALVRQVGVEQDVTERKRAEARGALQHAITQVLAEGRPLDPTMARLLEIIGRGLEADFAAFWAMNRTGKALRCAQWWLAPEATAAEFVELSRTIEYAPGAGLPGQVWAELEPAFVVSSELAHDERYVRRAAAMRAGLRSACAFPIVLRNEICGVVEVFMGAALPRDPELLQLFSALGSQLGQFIDRQKLEEQYRQSQKMEAVGTLAGGIAHDFNNVLTAIGGYCELALIELPPGAPAAPHLQAVQDGARRAAELVRQIMAFSRQQPQQRQPMSLATVVVEAMRLLRATIPATIEIKTAYEANLPPVLADATSMHQIVVNLCTNACHAMRDRPGRLSVTLSSMVVDENFAVAHRGLKPGRHVVLAVEDTGTGMDEATLARIFEPFFTTKAPGEGTGLGLAVVHGIVQSHDGAVFVYSQPGEGTRFHVYFPAHQGVAGEAAVATTPVPRGHGERVLYVEDEPGLAEMGRQMLVRLGYVPEVRTQPEQALAWLGDGAPEVALLVTDLTMPGMTGLEFARKAREVRPGLPVVLMSGYAAALAPDKMAAAGIREFITKPHSLEGLARVVAKVLQPPPA